MTDDRTAKVREAAQEAASARRKLEAQIVRARKKGASLRSIAAAAGMSHEQVRKIAVTTTRDSGR